MWQPEKYIQESRVKFVFQSFTRLFQIASLKQNKIKKNQSARKLYE